MQLLRNENLTIEKFKKFCVKPPICVNIEENIRHVLHLDYNVIIPNRKSLGFTQYTAKKTKVNLSHESF